jgi:hypothetical protein
MILTILLAIVFAAVTGMLIREGLWRSILAFFNVLLAATLATGWHSGIASWLTSLSRSVWEFRYLLDFLLIWMLFCVIFSLAREATDRMSRRAVVFPPLVERIGGVLVALMTGWLVLCFTAASLHTAPVQRDVIQPTPETRMFLGLSPDRRWLSWVRRSSLSGPFSRPQAPFDPEATFILSHADRRFRLEKAAGLRVAEE